MSVLVVRAMARTVLFAALLGLTACGGGVESRTGGSPSPLAPSSVGTTDASVPPVTPVTAALSVTGPGGEKLSLDSVPKRIVCLTGLCDDVLVELGLKPIGTSTPGLLALPEFLGAEASSVAKITGSFGGEDVESIAALKPDLVVGLSGAHDQMRASVEQFAPLWLLDVQSYKDSVDYLRAFATLTDRPDEQVKAETSFSQKLASAQSAGRTGLMKTTALTMYSSGGGQGVNTSDDLLGGLMGEIFTYPWPSKGGGYDTAQVYSVEEILSVDPQIIFVQSFTDKPDAPKASQELASNPVWREITAVKNDKVIEVDTNLWTAGRGPRALGLVLDQAVAAAS